MFLTWITQCVKQAVLKGFKEATEELELTNDADALAQLRECMTPRPAIAAPEAESKARKGK